MELALDVLAIAAGIAIVAATLGSAIKTVILPRASASSITRWVFLTMRRIYLVLAPRGLSYERRDRRLATYAPVSLTVTLAVWLVLVFVGYLLIFVGVDDQLWRDAFTLSGSSLFTLGFSHPVGLPATALAFSEAAIGLFLLALLITYLPAIYSAYSRREVGVTSLEVRAGSPPSAREMIWRHWMLERIGELGAVWQEQTVLVPPGEYRDAFTGRSIYSPGSLRLSECFESFPLLLLVSEASNRKAAGA
jgi:hypothetical protein